MVMRTEPALKLERSPLILVLSQIRFSPVLKMADFVPDIQEKMRHGRARAIQPGGNPAGRIRTGCKDKSIHALGLW